MADEDLAASFGGRSFDERIDAVLVLENFDVLSVETDTHSEFFPQRNVGVSPGR